MSIMANDAEQGWERLRKIMDMLPAEFQSRDLYNTAECVERYMEARPFDRRAVPERRRTPGQIESEIDTLMESLGFKL